MSDEKDKTDTTHKPKKQVRWAEDLVKYVEIETIEHSVYSPCKKCGETTGDGELCIKCFWDELSFKTDTEPVETND